MKGCYEKAKLKLQPPNPHEPQLREKADGFHVKSKLGRQCILFASSWAPKGDLALTHTMPDLLRIGFSGHKLCTPFWIGYALLCTKITVTMRTRKQFAVFIHNSYKSFVRNIKMICSQPRRWNRRMQMRIARHYAMLGNLLVRLLATTDVHFSWI